MDRNKAFPTCGKDVRRSTRGKQRQVIEGKWAGGHRAGMRQQAKKMQRKMGLGQQKKQLVMHGDFILRGVVSQGQLAVQARQQQRMMKLMLGTVCAVFACCMILCSVIFVTMLNFVSGGNAPESQPVATYL